MNKGLITVKISPYELKTNNNKRICIIEINKFSQTKNLSVNKDNK